MPTNKLPKNKFPWPIAFCNEQLIIHGADPNRVCNELAAAGYSGVEIAPFTLTTPDVQLTADNLLSETRAKAREWKEAATQAGLSIPALHWLGVQSKPGSFNLVNGDRAVRISSSRYLGQLAELAAYFDAKVMILGSPKQRQLEGTPTMTFDEGATNLRDILTGAVPLLEQNRVQLLLEPLAPTETNFINTAAEAKRIAHSVCSWIGYMLDVKAMIGGETDVLQTIRQFGRDALHLHLNDEALGPPGSGKTDFRPILQEAGSVYSQGRWMSVEIFTKPQDPLQLARDTMTYLLQAAA